MRRKLTVLVAMAVMLAMMLANAGMAWAANGSFATGAAHANPNAAKGLSTVVAKNPNADICDICIACC